jgi:hypothetical protein
MTMTRIDQALETVRAVRDSTREYLATTDWLGEHDLVDIERLEADLVAQFEESLAALVSRLGPFEYDDRSDRAAVDAWYPEALRFACWRHDGGLLFLALEWHDRETPIGLLVGFATQDDVRERSV